MQVLTRIAEQLPLLAGSCDFTEVGDCHAVTITMRAVRDVCNHFTLDNVSGEAPIDDATGTLVSLFSFSSLFVKFF